VDEAPQRTDAEGALMSGPPDYSTNPFLAGPQPGFIPAPDPGGLLSGIRQGNPFQDGILLSPQEQAALAAAPRRPAGTEVTVQATPVHVLGVPTPFRHMYVQYDDGPDQLIARGGPSLEGPAFFGGTIDGSDRVSAGVGPASQSKDYGAGGRVLAQRFLPNETVQQAAFPARVHAGGVNHGGNFYGIWDSNSNSFAADVSEPIFGRRPGDVWTPGSRTRLRDDGAAPPPLDLSPALGVPRF
jgi:hypothetical protein